MTDQKNTSLVGCSSSIIERFGSFADIAPKLHPIQVQSKIVELGILSNKQALQRDNQIRLSQFTAAYSKDNSYKIIELWLYDLSDYAGVKGKLSPEQLRQTAILFYSEAYCLNFTELGLFFNRVKKGDYGDFYGSVDPIRIMSFLKLFMKDRSDAIERINNENSQKERVQAEIDWNKKKESMSEEDYKTINETINNFIKRMTR